MRYEIVATAGVTFSDTPAVNDMPSKALQGRSGTAGVHVYPPGQISQKQKIRILTKIYITFDIPWKKSVSVLSAPTSSQTG